MLLWLFLLFYKSWQKRVFFSPLEEKEDIPSKFEALEEIVEIEEAGAWLQLALWCQAIGLILCLSKGAAVLIDTACSLTPVYNARLNKLLSSIAITWFAPQDQICGPGAA